MTHIESNSPRRAIREEIQTFLTQKGEDWWKYFSASILTHWRIMFEDFVPRYLHGRVLDDGCGNTPYLEVIRQYSEQLVLLDHNISYPELNVCSDVRKLPFSNDSFDCVLSFQVLEHVANPFEAMQEIGRILKPGGVLLLSVPHLSRLHELPHDYFRYTENGLLELAKSANLEVLEIKPTGGLIVFLGHQISMVFMTSLWQVKFLRPLLLAINKYFLTKFLVAIDKFAGFPFLFPQGYAMVAKKQ
ncbi:MAG: class I SAM-dependent methyltransferase [Prolixibacteraceae bacterium]|jgi:SAM-dependent methyltransferase|nr:class I SAM-dependent methyltransferase [Prolixibacteraceae bacterium]